MVSLALEERGISVTAVGNGEAAVRRIPDLDPDLVLADIFMPVRNGYEVCEFVKKDERFAHVPVILLVGAFDPLDEKEARRVGADGVLKKPFVPPDPLIAMVTAALEKNPRVAAELAKAKEAKMAPPEPEPLPSVDLSMRPEPKPLPDFPEPTAEEAALIYGMGKGQRTLKDDEPGAHGAEDEPPAPKLDPNARVADEDDEQSTSADWRRSAMDIEIPEDVASKPAIPSMEGLEPISFPSEKDYPPRRVRMPEPVEEVQPAVVSDSSTSTNGFSLRQINGPDSGLPNNVPARAGIPEEPALKIEPDTRPMGQHTAADTAAPSTALPEPNSTAVGGHWLDAVSAPLPGKKTSDWMDALIAAPAVSQPPVAEAVAESRAAIQEAPVAAPEVALSGAAQLAEEEELVAESPLATAEPSGVASVDPAELHEAEHHERVEDDSFFADEAAGDAEVTTHANEADSHFFAEAAPRAEGEVEMDADDSQPSIAMKDPDLVEPPAVRVTPEPLLVDEEPSAPSRYGSPAEETAPLHTFFEPSAEAPAIAPSVAAQPSTTEFSIQAQSDTSAESSDEESGERIPTMPPPNREALSHIPFLTPPPSFLAEINNGDSRQALSADSATIDTVVRKVLEKLQPQIQELLSQGLLKPLVENMLHNELDKKR